jgi:hypothetical protein
MAVQLGKNAALYWDGTKMARINNYNVTVNGVVVDVTELGDDWESSRIVINNWAAAVEGYFDLSDTQQNALHTRAISGGYVTELEFYEEEGGFYWKADTATDPEARIYVEAYNWVVDKSGVLTFTMTLKGSGPVIRTS